MFVAMNYIIRAIKCEGIVNLKKLLADTSFNICVLFYKLHWPFHLVKLRVSALYLQYGGLKPG